MAELYEQRFNPVQQYMDADTGDDMPGRDAGKPVEVQTGPQGRFTRWLDEQLQHGERWWRGKQAARDARMGLED
jgi:hypothetical protein